MSGSFTTGAWYYRGLMEEGGTRVAGRPALRGADGGRQFPGRGDLWPPPRSFAERAYNIVRWSEPPSGGHFAAMEAPDVFVEDLRAWAAG